VAASRLASCPPPVRFVAQVRGTTSATSPPLGKSRDSVVDSPNMKTLVLGLLLTLSAFAQKIDVESDQSVVFSRFKTFTLKPGRLNSKNPALNSLTRILTCSPPRQVNGKRPLLTFAGQNGIDPR
jgi:hypothetical protein